MAFTLIKGSFHVRNYSPDGDSLRFQPDNQQLMRDLQGPPPRFNARGHVQLRIEAIDSLETHFTPPGSGVALHQPLEMAHAAVDRLLDFCGISNVQWDSMRRTVLSADDGVRGYVLARTVEKNGRPVCFVFAGDPPEADGAAVFFSVERLRSSYNYAALAEGLAYPTYYEGLFHDLRTALTDAAKAAREQRLGVFAVDRTNAGFSAANLGSITDDFAILPKLFRRLSEYLVSMGTAVGFKEKLAQNQEPVLDLRTTNFTHFDTFVDQPQGSADIRLTRLPEELVFDPMPTRPPDSFALLLDPGAEVILDA